MIAKLQVATRSKLFNPGPMAALEEGVHTVVGGHTEPPKPTRHTKLGRHPRRRLEEFATF